MFKTRRKSFFSSQSSYRPYGKPSPRRWRLLVLILCLLLGLELLLRLGFGLTGNADALQYAGKSAVTADYRLAYGDASGKLYKDLSSQGKLVVRRSPLQGYELQKDQSGQHWSISAQGFRAPLLAPLLSDKKPTNEMRIFVLGGSTAFGQLSSSDQTTISYQLERQLNERVGKQKETPGQFQPPRLPYYADEQAIALAKPKRIQQKQYRVINAAVPGYISSNERSQFIHQVSHYQPDMLVLIDGYTDLLIPSNQIASDIPQIDEILDNARSHFLRSVRVSISQFLNRFYTVKVTRYAISIRNQRSKSNSQAHLKYSLHLPPELPKDKLELNRRIDRYEVNLADLAHLTSMTKTPLIVAIQPEISDRLNHNPSPAEQAVLNKLNRDYPQQIEIAYEQLQQSVEKVKKTYPNVSSLNLRDLYEKTETEAFQDPIHLTDKANQILAKKLYSAIAKTLEINSEPNLDSR